MVRPDNFTRSPQAPTSTPARTGPTVVWPDPSPLASWWLQVMRPGSGERAAFDAV
ncbi:hypothetical protein ACIBCN_41900 [Nocardia sp. NPDC051052]|uniref:hypothetical protein n=1 Tax=Nocardia sp. NPDC051052 TaxID=3364322 RepID=UPI003789004B